MIKKLRNFLKRNCKEEFFLKEDVLINNSHTLYNQDFEQLCKKLLLLFLRIQILLQCLLINKTTNKRKLEYKFDSKEKESIQFNYGVCIQKSKIEQERKKTSEEEKKEEEEKEEKKPTKRSSTKKTTNKCMERSSSEDEYSSKKPKAIPKMNKFEEKRIKK